MPRIVRHYGIPQARAWADQAEQIFDAGGVINHQGIPRTLGGVFSTWSSSRLARQPSEDGCIGVAAFVLIGRHPRHCQRFVGTSAGLYLCHC